MSKQNSEKILVTEFVESIDSYFAKSMCFVAPLVLEESIKIKVLGALSLGIPVLTNEIGIEGILVINQKVFSIAKNQRNLKK